LVNHGLRVRESQAWDSSCLCNIAEVSDETVSQPDSRPNKAKRKKIIVSLVVLVSLIAGFQIVSSLRREARVRNASREFKIVVDEFCAFADTQIAATKSRSLAAEEIVDKAYDDAWDRRGSIISNLDLSWDAWDEVNLHYDTKLKKCRDKATRAIAPATTAAPRIKSDAETVAEGNSCSKQWRRAASETASGSSNDVELRGTLYACNTLEDWITEAIRKGEYSDYLLAAACAFERDAPLCG